LRKLFVFLVLILSLPVNAFAHGVFLDVSHMHGEIGQEITVQVGWGYVFLGHDGSAITAEAPLRRMFLISPNGTEAPMTYAIFHQYYGRDYSDNPINQITEEQLNTDEFPTGGRHITYIEVTFTPQNEGYYQVVFHRDRSVPTAGGNEGRQITDVARAFILVGETNAEHSRLTGINRTEILPISEVGSLTAEGIFEGYALYAGQPLANYEVRLEIAAHEYTIVVTDAQGRFELPLPQEAGNFAMRVQRDEEISGTLHGQDFTSIRDIHILQVAVLANEEAPAAPAATPAAEATPQAPPASADPLDLPPLFAFGNIAMLIAGGVLLLAAGFFFGFSFTGIKSNKNGSV
jgi:uncharacterized GH25 family protein